MTRKDILMKADQCVNGQREQDYGTPEDNFRVIADLWSTYLDRIVTPVDVSMMMCLLKIARVRTSSITGPADDCFVDICGYAACGGEAAHREGRTRDSHKKETDEEIYKRLTTQDYLDRVRRAYGLEKAEKKLWMGRWSEGEDDK